MKRRVNHTVENKFFAYLFIVVGVFVCFGGGCAALLGLFSGGLVGLGGLIALAIGIVMISYGRSELNSNDQNKE